MNTPSTPTYTEIIHNAENSAEHTYTAEGEKTITITGDVTAIATSWENTNLTSADVSLMPGLVYLDCGGTFPSLDLSGNTALAYLSVRSGNTQLQWLSCTAMSGLEELNVKGVTSLQNLHCLATGIRSLDLSDAHQLYMLFCRENENLTALDLTVCRWL